MAASERSPLLANSPPSSHQQRKVSSSDNEEGQQVTWGSRLLERVKIAPRNQGLLFVLGAEMVGATMDATVRYVQQGQGRTSFPVFEVGQLSHKVISIDACIGAGLLCMTHQELMLT